MRMPADARTLPARKFVFDRWKYHVVTSWFLNLSVDPESCTTVCNLVICLSDHFF